VLFGFGLVLVRLSIPADPLAEPTWVVEGSGPLRLALTVMPLSALAFLWFVGVVRDRLGGFQDRFLATVFFGSGLLWASCRQSRLQRAVSPCRVGARAEGSSARRGQVSERGTSMTWSCSMVAKSSGLQVYSGRPFETAIAAIIAS
jgi:hypothetical protein